MSLARRSPTKDSCVPFFRNVSDVKEAQRAREEGRYADMYPRDTTLALKELESIISRMVGVPDTNIVTFSSGMAALTNAIESAAPTAGSSVLHGDSEYSRTTKFIDLMLSRRGVDSAKADSRDIESIRREILLNKPSIIVFETATNGPDMALLDLEAFFSLKELRECKPTVILDNTLPTPTLITPDLIFRLAKDLKVLVVESGTKFYALNAETLGIIYSNDQKAIAKLRDERSTTGTILTFSQTLLLLDVLKRTYSQDNPESMKAQFDARNRLIISNANLLALGCELHEGPQSLTIAYPNLRSHQNHQLAIETYPNGSSPVFFITSKNGDSYLPYFETKSGPKDQFELLEALLLKPYLRENTVLRQSFGFDSTTIYPYPDPTMPCIRVSAGTEDVDKVMALASSLRKALSDL